MTDRAALLVTDAGVAMPLLLGTGIGTVIDRVLFPAPDREDAQPER